MLNISMPIDDTLTIGGGGTSGAEVLPPGGLEEVPGSEPVGPGGGGTNGNNPVTDFPNPSPIQVSTNWTPLTLSFSTITFTLDEMNVIIRNGNQLGHSYQEWYENTNSFYIVGYAYGIYYAAVSQEALLSRPDYNVLYAKNDGFTLMDSLTTHVKHSIGLTTTEINSNKLNILLRKQVRIANATMLRDLNAIKISQDSIVDLWTHPANNTVPMVDAIVDLYMQMKDAGRHMPLQNGEYIVLQFVKGDIIQSDCNINCAAVNSPFLNPQPIPPFRTTISRVLTPEVDIIAGEDALGYEFEVEVFEEYVNVIKVTNVPVNMHLPSLYKIGSTNLPIQSTIELPSYVNLITSPTTPVGPVGPVLLSKLLPYYYDTTKLIFKVDDADEVTYVFIDGEMGEVVPFTVSPEGICTIDNLVPNIYRIQHVKGDDIYFEILATNPQLSFDVIDGNLILEIKTTVNQSITYALKIGDDQPIMNLIKITMRSTRIDIGPITNTTYVVNIQGTNITKTYQAMPLMLSTLLPYYYGITKLIFNIDDGDTVSSVVGEDSTFETTNNVCTISDITPGIYTIEHEGLPVTFEVLATNPQLSFVEGNTLKLKIKTTSINRPVTYELIINAGVPTVVTVPITTYLTVRSLSDELVMGEYVVSIPETDISAAYNVVPTLSLPALRPYYNSRITTSISFLLPPEYTLDEIMLNSRIVGYTSEDNRYTIEPVSLGTYDIKFNDDVGPATKTIRVIEELKSNNFTYYPYSSSIIFLTPTGYSNIKAKSVGSPTNQITTFYSASNGLKLFTMNDILPGRYRISYTKNSTNAQQDIVVLSNNEIPILRGDYIDNSVVINIYAPLTMNRNINILTSNTDTPDVISTTSYTLEDQIVNTISISSLPPGEYIFECPELGYSINIIVPVSPVLFSELQEYIAPTKSISFLFPDTYTFTNILNDGVLDNAYSVDGNRYTIYPPQTQPTYVINYIDNENNNASKTINILPQLLLPTRTFYTIDVINTNNKFLIPSDVSEVQIEPWGLPNNQITQSISSNVLTLGFVPRGMYDISYTKNNTRSIAEVYVFPDNVYFILSGKYIYPNSVKLRLYAPNLIYQPISLVISNTNSPDNITTLSYTVNNIEDFQITIPSLAPGEYLFLVPKMNNSSVTITVPETDQFVEEYYINPISFTLPTNYSLLTITSNGDSYYATQENDVITLDVPPGIYTVNYNTNLNESKTTTFEVLTSDIVATPVINNRIAVVTVKSIYPETVWWNIDDPDHTSSNIQLAPSRIITTGELTPGTHTIYIYQQYDPAAPTPSNLVISFDIV